jgi:hypothetical protein
MINALSFMPRMGFQMSASNPTLQTANGLSACSRATRLRKCTFECARTTPFSVGSYLRGTRKRVNGWKSRGLRKEEVLHLMIMVSSISSTPECNLFAKTGGTARTIDALTERNSSLAFSLRAFFGEPSTSMGTGEPFRFILMGTVIGTVLAFVGWRQMRVYCAEVVTNLAVPAHAGLTDGPWHSYTVFPACHHSPCSSSRYNMVCLASHIFWRNGI